VGGGFWVVTFVAGSIPFSLAVAIASRFKIRTGWYYALCGICTGLLFGVLLTVFADLGDSSDGQPPMQRGERLVFACKFATLGFAGAMTYWWKRGRLAGTETS
jgi:hypothetical protein